MSAAKIAANTDAHLSFVNILSNKTLICELYLHTLPTIRGLSDTLPFAQQ